MDLEITIKVPLGANVSVQQETTGGRAGIPEPPSPAGLGIPTAPSAAELEPPSAEMMERIVAAMSATPEGPPQLDQLPPEVLGGGFDATAGPPDLSAIGEVPLAEDEFAPPSSSEKDLMAPSQSSPHESG